MYNETTFCRLNEGDCDKAESVTEYTRLLEQLEQQEQSQLQNTARLNKEYNLRFSKGDPRTLKSSLSNYTNKCNNISKIQLSDGTSTSDCDEILEEFTSYFQKLYKPNENTDYSLQKTLVESFSKENKIPEELSAELEEPISIHEFEEAIDNLNVNGAPGPDGLTPSFYKHSKSFYAPYLTSILNRATESNCLPQCFLGAIIKLIPKDSRF